MLRDREPPQTRERAGGVRPPAAAGRFYPGSAVDLASEVDRLLAAARPRMLQGDLRALVVPHAGYVYSGPVAAGAFAAIGASGGPLRVALLGPSHFWPIDGAVVSDAQRWRTPLGEVPVDEGLRTAAVEAGADVDPAAHRDDHALEVQLPFLQRIASGDLSVLPVAVGGHTTDTIALLVSRLAGSALIVVSTDLSHYLDDTEARRRDRRTAERVTALDHRAIGDHDACGASALRALLACAHDADWHCELLELRTSADAGAGTTSVVGYGAFALTSGSGARIPA